MSAIYVYSIEIKRHVLHYYRQGICVTLCAFESCLSPRGDVWQSLCESRGWHQKLHFINITSRFIDDPILNPFYTDKKNLTHKI